MSVQGIRVAFVPGGASLKPAAWDQSNSHRFVNMLSWVFTRKCQHALSATKRLIHSKINYFQNRDCG